jgi:hypothetical protein
MDDVEARRSVGFGSDETSVESIDVPMRLGTDVVDFSSEILGLATPIVAIGFGRGDERVDLGELSTLVLDHDESCLAIGFGYAELLFARACAQRKVRELISEVRELVFEVRDICSRGLQFRLRVVRFAAPEVPVHLRLGDEFLEWVDPGGQLFGGFAPMIAIGFGLCDDPLEFSESVALTMDDRKAGLAVGLRGGEARV